MEKVLFDELKQSLLEAGAIARGDTVTMIARRAVPGLTAAMETQG